VTEPTFDFASFLPRAASRLKPEVLHALKVILSAIFDEPLEEQRAVTLQRKSTKKKKKAGVGLKKKASGAAPGKAGVIAPRCRAISFTGDRCVRHGSHAGKHRGRSGTWIAPLRKQCRYRTKTGKQCLLSQGHDGRHVPTVLVAAKGSKRK